MVMAPKLLNNRCARYQNKSPGQGQNLMSNTSRKQVEKEEAATMTVVKNEDPEVVEAVIVEQVPELTIDQKIQKVEDLVTLIDKYHKLKESHRNLQTFTLASDGFTNQLSLRSTTSGFDFKTFNSAVIAEVVAVIESTLSKKIAEIEAQIRF